ncbi:MAG: hypothetical protein NTW32_20995 [Chloroflexi bacterium]|nr:hypothetical protein [Chloroflexota bacterium]
MRDFIKQTGLQRQGVRERVIMPGGISPISPVLKTPAFMKSYPGTSIKLSGNSKIRKVVKYALDELEKQGYSFPATIKTDYKFFEKYKVLKTSPCAYMNDVLYINNRHNMWKNPKGWMKEEYADGWLSTDKPEGAIWHEVGHFLHEKSNTGIYNKYILTGFPNSGDEVIALQVSKYAKENANEFIAEVFAAHVAGMDSGFSLDVFILFNSLGGVK